MKLVTCTRKVNGITDLYKLIIIEVLGTIEYIDNKNDLVFQTTTDEKEHLVFQLGVPTPELAIQAAKVVYKLFSIIIYIVKMMFLLLILIWDVQSNSQFKVVWDLPYLKLQMLLLV